MPKKSQDTTLHKRRRASWRRLKIPYIPHEPRKTWDKSQTKGFWATRRLLSQQWLNIFKFMSIRKPQDMTLANLRKASRRLPLPMYNTISKFNQKEHRRHTKPSWQTDSQRHNADKILEHHMTWSWQNLTKHRDNASEFKTKPRKTDRYYRAAVNPYWRRKCLSSDGEHRDVH